MGDWDREDVMLAELQACKAERRSLFADNERLRELYDSACAISEQRRKDLFELREENAKLRELLGVFVKAVNTRATIGQLNKAVEEAAALLKEN